MIRSDYVKIAILLLLTLLCVFSGFQRFPIFTSSDKTSRNKLSITTNYSVCESLRGSKNDQMSQCIKDMDFAFATARSVCANYLSAANNCISVGNGNCRGQISVLESCVDAVITPEIRKWSAQL